MGLRLSEVDGAPPAFRRGDIVLKGHARTVEYEGRLIGQIVVASVAAGESEVAIEGDPLAAQFDLEEAVIEKDREVLLKGDLAALLAALEELAAATEGGEGVLQRIEIEGPGQAPSASGQVEGNELAGQYRTPERQERKPDPEVTARVTAEGCQVRVDMAQLVAIQQSKTVTMEDGVPKQESACSDSSVRYPLQKDYAGCPDDVDLPSRSARPQFRWYYAEGENGPRRTVGECLPDEDAEFAIVEDHAPCSVETDFANERAVPRAVLVYENRENRRVIARDCAPSQSRGPVDMYRDPAGCRIAHDFANGRSERYAAWRYVLGGVTYQASACAGTEEYFTHETVYRDSADAWICPRVAKGSAVILQSRVRITVDGEARYIRECVPDTAGTEVSSTTEGCDDPSEWTHDLTAGVSYGQERFYFVHNGKREYVTDCVDSDVTYIHDVTVAGYRHHDDRRFSHALSKVTIEAPSGEHVIVDGVVLPGAPQVPYEWLREALVPAGAPSYSGCEKTEPRDRIECWRRPSVAPPPETMARGDCDGSEYRRTLGPGEAVVTADVCTAQVSASWTLIDGSPVTHADGPCCGWKTVYGDKACQNCPKPSKRVCKARDYLHSSEYRGTMTLVRDDGVEAGTEEGTGRYGSSSTYCVNTPGATYWEGATFAETKSLANKAPATVADRTRIDAWAVELGWK